MEYCNQSIIDIAPSDKWKRGEFWTNIVNLETGNPAPELVKGQYKDYDGIVYGIYKSDIGSSYAIIELSSGVMVHASSKAQEAKDHIEERYDVYNTVIIRWGDNPPEEVKQFNKIQ